MPSAYVPAAGRPFRERFPFFKFDPSAFLSSPKVARMSPQEIGCYMLLLCQQWLEGSVSADPLELEDLCKGLAPTPLVLRCFERGVDGRLRNPRLDALRRECEARSEARSKSGRAGAASSSQPEQQQTGSALAGAGKGEASAYPLPSSSSPGAEHREGKGEAEREGEEEREVVTGLSDSPLSCNRRSELPPKGANAPRAPGERVSGTRAPRRNGRTELRRALTTWRARCGGMPPPEDLEAAMERFRARRARNRHPVWEADQFVAVFAKAGWDPVVAAEAFSVAADNGWQGVFPRVPGGAPSGPRRTAYDESMAVLDRWEAEHGPRDVDVEIQA